MHIVLLIRDKVLLELITSFKETYASLFAKKLCFRPNLISQNPSLNESQEFQIQNNSLNTRFRRPIKLKDIETFVEDCMLVRKRNEGAHGRA